MCIMTLLEAEINAVLLKFIKLWSSSFIQQKVVDSFKRVLKGQQGKCLHIDFHIVWRMSSQEPQDQTPK